MVRRSAAIPASKLATVCGTAAFGPGRHGVQEEPAGFRPTLVRGVMRAFVFDAVVLDFANLGHNQLRTKAKLFMWSRRSGTAKTSRFMLRKTEHYKREIGSAACSVGDAICPSPSAGSRSRCGPGGAHVIRSPPGVTLPEIRGDKTLVCDHRCYHGARNKRR